MKWKPMLRVPPRYDAFHPIDPKIPLPRYRKPRYVVSYDAFESIAPPVIKPTRKKRV